MIYSRTARRLIYRSARIFREQRSTWRTSGWQSGRLLRSQAERTLAALWYDCPPPRHCREKTLRAKVRTVRYIHPLVPVISYERYRRPVSRYGQRSKTDGHAIALCGELYHAVFTTSQVNEALDFSCERRTTHFHLDMVLKVRIVNSSRAKVAAKAIRK